MGAISAALPAHGGAGPTLIKRLGFKEGEVPERTAAIVLRVLGLSATAANAVARRPLPELASSQAD
jgi:hypothetical protein